MVVAGKLVVGEYFSTLVARRRSANLIIPMTLIADLVSLHLVDSQVRALRSRLDSAEHYVALQEKQRLLLSSRMDETKSQIRQHQATGVNHEAESGSVKARIDTLRNQLNTSTNPKQYAAVLNELKLLQTQRDEIDELTIDQIQKTDDLQTKLVELERLSVERVKVRDAGQAELNTCRGEVGSRLGELDRERTVAAAKIPQRDLDIFNRAADLYDGEAMAELVAVDARRREYSCAACNMELPVEKYASLASNPNLSVTCTSCHRILYLGQVSSAVS